MQCSLRSSVGRSHGKAERMVRFRQGAPYETKGLIYNQSFFCKLIM